MLIDPQSHDVDEMECRELLEVFTERFEETLLGPTRRRVQAHLDSCPSCRHAIRSGFGQTTTELTPTTEPNGSRRPPFVGPGGIDAAFLDPEIGKRLTRTPSRFLA